MAERRVTPVAAIKNHCKKCSGGSAKEVKMCVIPECDLFPFRLGKNPNCGPRGPRKKKKVDPK